MKKRGIEKGMSSATLLFLIVTVIAALFGTATHMTLQEEDPFPPGTIFAAEQGTGSLIAILPDGTKDMAARGFRDPRGIAIEAAGTIIVVEQSAGQITRFFPGRRFRSTERVRDGLNIPEGVAIDRNGNILVTEFGAGRLVRISADGDSLAMLADGLAGPTGVDVDLEGNIYVAEFLAGRILRISSEPAGKISDTTLVADGLSTPDLLAVAPNGRIYVVEFDAGQITEVDLLTATKRVVISELTTPVGVAVGPASSSFSKVAQTPTGEAVYCTNNPVSGQTPNSDELREIDARTGDFRIRANMTNGAGLAAKPFPDPVRVQFYQLNWLGEDGESLFPNSNVGVARLFFSPGAAQLLDRNGGAYFNLVLDTGQGPQWSVQNLHLSYPDLRYMLNSSPTVYFDLGLVNGTPLTQVLYDLSITPEPLAQLPGPPVKVGPVGPTDYHAGGVNGGGSGLANIPLNIGPWVGPRPPINPPLRKAYSLLAGGDLPLVEEDINGCAPAAAARSITYMMDRAGIKTDPTQMIYEDLIDDMNSDVGKNSEGTDVNDMLAGKREYTETNGLPITSALILPARRGKPDQGNNCPQEAMDILEQGFDLEVIIGWDGGGGHAAMVTSIICLDKGQIQITYVDDPKQGDGRAENEEHAIIVNPDGSFQGGQVDGFMIEGVQK